MIFYVVHSYIVFFIMYIIFYSFYPLSVYVMAINEFRVVGSLHLCFVRFLGTNCFEYGA